MSHKQKWYYFKTSLKVYREGMKRDWKRCHVGSTSCFSVKPHCSALWVAYNITDCLRQVDRPALAVKLSRHDLIEEWREFCISRVCWRLDAF